VNVENISLMLKTMFTQNINKTAVSPSALVYLQVLEEDTSQKFSD